MQGTAASLLIMFAVFILDLQLFEFIDQNPSTRLPAAVIDAFNNIRSQIVRSARSAHGIISNLTFTSQSI
jgi:hypothetical protein